MRLREAGVSLVLKDDDAEVPGCRYQKAQKEDREGKGDGCGTNSSPEVVPLFAPLALIQLSSSSPLDG